MAGLLPPHGRGSGQNVILRALDRHSGKPSIQPCDSGHTDTPCLQFLVCRPCGGCIQVRLADFQPRDDNARAAWCPPRPPACSAHDSRTRAVLGSTTLMAGDARRPLPLTVLVFLLGSSLLTGSPSSHPPFPLFPLKCDLCPSP